MTRKYDLPANLRKITQAEKQAFKKKWGEPMPNWYKKLLLENKKSTIQRDKRLYKKQFSKNLREVLKKRRKKN